MSPKGGSSGGGVISNTGRTDPECSSSKVGYASSLQESPHDCRALSPRLDKAPTHHFRKGNRRISGRVPPLEDRHARRRQGYISIFSVVHYMSNLKNRRLHSER